VRRLTQLLDVDIVVRSSPGRGSVFKFNLPRSEEVPLTPMSAGATSVRTASAVADAIVLVIDDEAQVREAMAEALRSWGLRPITARSLQCALERLAECERYPDALVSDFRLGEDQNGIDAVERIRHELGFPIPAMIVTGDTAPTSLRVIQASGLRCLPKPVTADRLLQELTSLLACNANESTKNPISSRG